MACARPLAIPIASKERESDAARIVLAAGYQYERALAIARTIAEQAPLAMRASLASSRRYLEKGPLGIKPEMEAVQRKLAQTADAAEGLKSFVERRKAKFTRQ